MEMIGNAHIDPVWLWRWQDGYAEVLATFASALDRLQENKGFVFTCAGACYYKWAEETDPAMFERIREAVREGRWVPVGGMWIQPDLNMPCGESLLRQLLFGQSYFREKLGVEVHTGYNVDSFGQSAMLPALLRAAGIRQYVWMRPNSDTENPAVPKGAMRWLAQDGSEVLAFHIPDEFGGYTRYGDVPAKYERMRELERETGHPMMCFYGVGNHGGGPTIENLREIDAIAGAEYSSPDRYFDRLHGEKDTLPLWEGEMQHHASGCYSTFSAGKRANRRAENALFRAERFGVLAQTLLGRKPKTEHLHRAWEDVLFNQFHDVMCGCCIRSGLEDAVIQENEAIMLAAREENEALQAIAWNIDTSGSLPVVRSKSETILWNAAERGTPVVVFNPHAFDAYINVTVPGVLHGAETSDGQPLAFQHIRAERTNGTDHIDTLLRVRIPSLGYRLIYVFNTPKPCTGDKDLRVKGCVLENGHLRARFSPETGEIASLCIEGREVLTAPSRTILVDIAHCDTWAHGVFTFDREIRSFGQGSVDVLESGPVRAAVKTRAKAGGNIVERIYRLYALADTIEVETRLTMADRHVLCKWEMNLCGAEYSAVPGGSIVRNATGMEEPSGAWVAVAGASCGLAVCNDGKQSYSYDGQHLRLTLSNTSAFADHYGQAYRDDSCSYMDMGEQRFNSALVPFAGAFRPGAAARRAEELNMPGVWINGTYHEGSLPEQYSLLHIAPEQVSLDALKAAEDGNGTVLRLTEQNGVECALRVWGEKLSLAPHSICTWRFTDTAAQTDALERPLREENE